MPTNFSACSASSAFKRHIFFQAVSRAHPMNAIVVKDLTRRFGDFVAVDHLTFDVRPGEIFGFLGSNGAGKSTTIRMLCGLLAPTSGTALVDGIDIVEEPLLAKARLGYLDEDPFVHPHLTGREFLHFVADLYRMPRGAERQ